MGISSKLDKIKYLARDIESSYKYRHEVTTGLCKGDVVLLIPSREYKRMPYFYYCSGCTHTHIDSRKLPEGVTRAGFISLMKTIFGWKPNK